MLYEIATIPTLVSGSGRDPGERGSDKDRGSDAFTMKRTTFEYRAQGLLSNATADDSEAYWSDDVIDTMDRAFCKRMLEAIAAGLERPSKRVNTTPGTKHPIVNYRRPN